MKTLVVILVLMEALAAARADAPATAEDLYVQGQAAFDHGDYATAIVKWNASYAASNESGLLFNIAQAEHLAGDCPAALATYRRFIRVDPTAEERTHAEDVVKELEGTCGPPKLPPTTSVPPPILNDHPERQGRTGRPLRMAGIVTSGIGVATLAIGLGLGHHGATIGDEVTAACMPTCNWQALQDKDERGRRDVAIGRTLDGLGVATIAAGAVLYYLGIRQDVTVVSRGHEGAVVSWGRAW